MCKSQKDLKQISTEGLSNSDEESSQDEDAYRINVFKIRSSQGVKPKLASNANKKKDFRVQVIVNNSLD